MSAVVVDRRLDQLLWLGYTVSGRVTVTVVVVGNGICYDTGGADIKAGGVMAGMHRDKCGASAVAGFFKVCFVVSFLPTPQVYGWFFKPSALIFASFASSACRLLI